MNFLKNILWKKVISPYMVFFTLAIGFWVGVQFPKNHAVQLIAQSGTILPQLIVTSAAPIIFFLLAGATHKLFSSQKTGAGVLIAKIFGAYLILGAAAVTWAGILIKSFMTLSTTVGENTSTLTLIKTVVGTFSTIISQQPILHMLVSGLFIGWLSATNLRFKTLAQGIQYVSSKILFVFKWLNWYYPIMIGCLAISIPSKFGAKGVAFYGKNVMWVAIGTVSWAMIITIVAKLLSHRTNKEIFGYLKEVYPVGFGTGGSYQTLAVSLVAAVQKMNLNKQLSEMVIIFGTVINKNAATIAALFTMVNTCDMMGIKISAVQVICVIPVVFILGLQTPGIPGGAGYFMSPVIAVVLSVPEPTLYANTFVTMYSGLIPMLATGTNTIANGLVASVVQDRVIEKGQNHSGIKEVA